MRWIRGCINAALTGIASFAVSSANATPVTISTPGGPVVVNIGHADPGGSLVAPSAPSSPDFRPPTIFSAPLPSGSGARALGFSGAFTALADDATAASWNPAGLIQLERPEASVVFRAGWENQQHRSSSDNFLASQDDFDSQNLNYFSVAYPFRAASRNAVFALNYQEAYDFTQRFTAGQLATSTGSARARREGTYSETTVQHVGADSSTFPDGTIDVDVTSHLTTRQTSVLDQILRSESVSALDFEQQGGIDAMTPALAVEITPKFALGAALNVYQDNMLGGHAIRSRTRALYSGTSASTVHSTDTRVTQGTYTYDGTIHVPPGAIIPIPMDFPISGAGTYDPITDTTMGDSSQNLRYEGVYDEFNTFDELQGFNGTIGGLWTVSRHLSLGADLDLPWTAHASQTKTVRNTITTYDSAGRVLDVAGSETVQTKDVEFRFPLYWALGAVWRWTPELYTTFDVSQTRWSDFSFQSEGDQKLNPLDGSVYGEHPVDDCWSARCGTEYLLVLTRTEVPLRAGVGWEQRPAIGEPDEYWSVSLGTGVSIGKEPGKVILDIAYIHTWADNALGSLVPDQAGLTTDVRRDEVYLSCITHF
ncbi:MAG: hypothetical protein WCL49_02580 [bacterium]